MAIYYRFDHERPEKGSVVHCFTNWQAFISFAQIMKAEDPEFYRMKFWEVEGQFVEDDEGDAQVRVISAKEIKLK